ncbi:MAG: phosphatase [Clostridiales bacterium]|nr:phosphatase [Clostridiales bacterium]
MKFLLDTHTHTIVSGHAYNTLYEMIQQAADIGLKLIGITEHAPAMPGTCGEFYFQNLRAIDRQYLHDKFGIEVLLGAELNIIDYNGGVDLGAQGIKCLDVVIASMHLPCLKSGTRQENTQAAIVALQNPDIDILGHPDDGRYPMEYEPIVRAAKQYGKLLEVNNSSLQPNGYRMNAKENYKIMLEYCKKYEQPIVVNSDAHFVTAVGNHQYAEQLLKEVQFPEQLVVNNSVEQFYTYTRKGKKNQ